MDTAADTARRQEGATPSAAADGVRRVRRPVVVDRAGAAGRAARAVRPVHSRPADRSRRPAAVDAAAVRAVVDPVAAEAEALRKADGRRLLTV